MSTSTELADLVRAIYEGVVFAHRTDLTYLLPGPMRRSPMSSASPAVRRAASSGRRCSLTGSAFPLKSQAAASLAPRAAPFAQRVATGVAEDLPDAIRNMVKLERRLEPNPGTRGGSLGKICRVFFSHRQQRRGVEEITICDKIASRSGYGESVGSMTSPSFTIFQLPRGVAFDA